MVLKITKLLTQNFQSVRAQRFQTMQICMCEIKIKIPREKKITV